MVETNKHYDFLIVGSGLFGATFNYFAQKKGYSCLVIEKRNHIGGNVYCENVSNIPVHKYGAHIFHTSDKDVWDLVSDNCTMVPFINSPIAIVYEDGHNVAYNLPFNMNTFSKMFNVVTPEEVNNAIDKEVAECGITNPTNLEEKAISLVGKTIYNKLIKGYTEKQWGRKCTDLPADIITRLPVRYTYDNNYFNDTYQGIPKGGYNELIDNLFKGADIVLNTDFNTNREYWLSKANKVIYTGPIDAFFDYSLGKLEWRSVMFKNAVYDVQNMQGNAVYNYTDHHQLYTRSIEHKFFDRLGEGFNQPKTIVSYEYSQEWNDSAEPYYPINNDTNNQLLNKYLELVDNMDNIYFCGRLGRYKYYDMDDTIIEAKKIAEKIL